MGLPYMLTLGWFWGVNVGIYGSPMECLGTVGQWNDTGENCDKKEASEIGRVSQENHELHVNAIAVMPSVHRNTGLLKQKRHSLLYQ